MLVSISTFSQRTDAYKLWFSRDGVDVYSWYYNGLGRLGIDKHLRLKMVNHNSYQVNVSWDHLNWEYRGSVVKQHQAQDVEINAGNEREGDMSGLWWYPPDGYDMHRLNINFVNFKVQRTERPTTIAKAM
jgi:hypothetical protein